MGGCICARVLILIEIYNILLTGKKNYKTKCLKTYLYCLMEQI